LKHYQLKFCTQLSESNKLCKSEKDFYYNLASDVLSRKGDYKVALNFAIKEMSKLGDIGEFIEDFQSTFRRLEEVKRSCQVIISNLSQTKNEKLLIVGHSVMLMSWYTQNVNVSDFSLARNEKDHWKLSNCEMVGISL